MRRLIDFCCNGARLVGTLDEASGTTGLLIVSGGSEIRIGAHRGMAMLARDIAAAGHPVLRFDRRGVGDSEGANPGFRASGPDIAAAIAAFRSECPHITRIIGFGICDAATALALLRPDGLDGLLLANPWVVERSGDLIERAAVRARYAEKLADPRSWLRLLSGRVDLARLMHGIVHIAKPHAQSALAREFAAGLSAFSGPVNILLAARDATAIAFAGEWRSEAFASVRAQANVTLAHVESGSHSFAGQADFAVLKSAMLRALA